MSIAAIPMPRAYRANEALSGGYLPRASLAIPGPAIPSLYIPGPQLPDRPASPRKGGRALRGRSQPELALDQSISVLPPNWMTRI